MKKISIIAAIILLITFSGNALSFSLNDLNPFKIIKEIKKNITKKKKSAEFTLGSSETTQPICVKMTSSESGSGPC